MEADTRSPLRTFNTSLNLSRNESLIEPFYMPADTTLHDVSALSVSQADKENGCNTSAISLQSQAFSRRNNSYISSLSRSHLQSSFVDVQRVRRQAVAKAGPLRSARFTLV